jgi:hypothetical protein
MRTFLLVVASFVLGAFASSFMRTTTVFAQQQTPEYQGNLVYRPTAIPQVPFVGLTKLTNVEASPQLALRLDGIDCIDCKLTPGAPVLYGGGAFQIERLQLNGPLELRLEGAAWNTLFLLNALHLIGCPRTAPQPDINPNQPSIQTAAFKGGTKLSLESPFGIKR